MSETKIRNGSVKSKRMSKEESILVVDDDNKSAQSIVETLKAEGYTVHTASREAGALERAIETLPSLIFVKAILGGESGFKLIRSIRKVETLKGVPFIMLTKTKEKFRNSYKLNYGIVDFLKMPFDKKDLVVKTKSIIPLKKGTAASVNTEEEALSCMKENHGPENHREKREGLSESEEISHEDKESPSVGPFYKESNKFSSEKEPFHRKGEDTNPWDRAGDKMEPERDDQKSRKRILINLVYEDEKVKQSILRPAIVIGLTGLVICFIFILTHTLLMKNDGSVKQVDVEKVSTGIEEKQTRTAKEPPIEDRLLGAGLKLTNALTERVDTVQLEKGKNPKTAKLQEEKKKQEIVQGIFSVQVGFFAKFSNATRLLENLRDKGYDTSIKKELYKKGVRYRVLIGTYGTKKEAQTMINTLKTTEKMNSILIKL